MISFIWYYKEKKKTKENLQVQSYEMTENIMWATATFPEWSVNAAFYDAKKCFFKSKSKLFNWLVGK